MKSKIALLVFTWSIDYDDRVRKEILSIQKLYPEVSFKIYAVESENREKTGITSYGIPYRTPYLKTRDKYPSGTHTIQKAWEFYSCINKELNEFDAIWCADPETIFFVIMNRKKPLLWDLHELPSVLMSKKITRLFFRWLESKCTVMVHANSSRLQYLQEIGMVRQPEKQFYLRNFAQFNEIDSEYDDTYNGFVDWLGKDKCVYLQGVSGDARADLESIGAVLAFKELKAVVVGRIKEERLKILESKYGKKTIEERLYFTGQIKQLKTPQYIKKCCMALVFYKNISSNNWYCEPNRLFQNVINGNPVVTGNNPPLKEYVEAGNYGISVNTDGSDMNLIIDGIKTVLDNYDFYKQNVTNISDSNLWDSQNDTICKIVDKFLFS